VPFRSVSVVGIRRAPPLPPLPRRRREAADRLPWAAQGPPRPRRRPEPVSVSVYGPDPSALSLPGRPRAVRIRGFLGWGEFGFWGFGVFLPPPCASRGLGKDFGGAMQGRGWGAVNCAAIVWLQELGSRVELVLLAPVGADCQIQVLNFG
jgi:hypothetical protein